MRRWKAGAALIGLALLCTGCAGSRQTQLESVAKDWCMVIRASQVIPVYPLSEDVLPGDIYLVTTTVDEQHRAYKDKGFLPLDNMIARLHPTGFDDFYRRSIAGDHAATMYPGRWLNGDAKDWEGAPIAAFPSYAFSVQRGGGVNIALPVQGVPLGMSLLGTDSATGTITMKKARTYGVDEVSLNQNVTRWANSAEARGFLQPFASDGKAGSKKRFVRVISRVYLAQKFDVSVVSTATTAFGADYGNASAVQLLQASDEQDVAKATRQNYTDAIDRMNRPLVEAEKAQAGKNSAPPPDDEKRTAAAAQIGASVRVVAASGRSVSLNEEFARPVVVGYLGFDREIRSDGTLGSPIPTLSVVEGRKVDSGAAPFSAAIQSYEGYLTLLATHPAGKDILAAAAMKLDRRSARRFAQIVGEQGEVAKPADAFRTVAQEWSDRNDDLPRAEREKRIASAIEDAIAESISQ